MRTLMMVVVAMVLLFGTVGCLGLSKIDQAKMTALTVEEKEVLMALYSERAAMFKHVETETRKVTDGIMNKTLTLSEGEQYIKLLALQSKTTFDKIATAIEDAKSKYQREKADLQAKGYGTGDMIVGLIYSLIGALTGMGGTRLARGAHVGPAPG